MTETRTTDIATDSPGKRPAAVAATAVSEVLAPWTVIPVMGLLIGLDAAPTTLQGLLWGGLAILFGAVFPMGFVLLGVKRGSWSDHHVPDRAVRRWPLAVSALSSAGGLAVLTLLGAPQEMIALTVGWTVALVVMAVITVAARWKISMHSMAITIATTGLAAVHPAAVATWPLVLLVGWSRLHLRHHTLTQLVAGALVGAAAMVVFALLR
ncbi:phosphoesterase PA-phosphatase [Nocardiopsis gilva]|nr:phosphoesterase PA-phosphatase [Nocardiopsis gilva]